MGTLDLICKFKGMRKDQSFIVYPIHEGMEADKIKIQSETRIGYINLNNGLVSLCPPIPSGAYNPHLMFVKEIDVLSKEELAGLKYQLIQTASKKAGNNSVCMYTDNNGADKVSIF